MGADLYESYVGSILAASALGVTAFTDKEYYVLSNEDEEAGFYMTEDVTRNDYFWNDANRAYLVISKGVAQDSTGFRLDIDGTTGVEEVNGENGEVKAVYDLTGRKLKGENGNLKGIYIINGKKILVK